jgi:hypothetical protein
VIAKAMYVLRPVFYAGQTGWRQAEGVYEGNLQERAKEEIAEELVPGESRVFHEPLRRLRKTMATEEASFITDEEKKQVPGSDKRQDFPFKGLPTACFADTGRQDRDDKRRDTPAEG